jgi:D-amino-acid dehydrogenase
VYVPLRPDPRLLRFLVGFARHSTARRWGLGMRAYAPMNRRALAAFDELTDNGVEAATRYTDPFMACFRTPEERAALVDELEHIRDAGQDVKYDLLSGPEARDIEPALSAAVGSVVRLHDQRYINPPEFVGKLARAVAARGGRILEGAAVSGVQPGNGGVYLTTRDGVDGPNHYDAVVLANGAWLGRLARRFGVRQPVQAGCGYSFSVSGEDLPSTPVYFPAQRVACTPLDGPAGSRLRVAGMMEFRAPDAELDRRRIDAIVDAARPLLNGVDLDDRRDEWVGSRPCTADGLPLIGGTRAPGVYVAGGHGMWGMALGPLTGKLLAQRIATGTTPPELIPFDPLR